MDNETRLRYNDTLANIGPLAALMIATRDLIKLATTEGVNPDELASQIKSFAGTVTRATDCHLSTESISLAIEHGKEQAVHPEG